MSRQPTVEWQVVGACNYSCSYCIQSARRRRGIPQLQQVQRAIDRLACLPGRWEIKMSGGEAFAWPGFQQELLPRLLERTPHLVSVLTNFSSSPRDLMRFAHSTRGRLQVFSASLHLEQVRLEDFLRKAAWFQDLLDPQVRFVVNQVVLPGREQEAAACRQVFRDQGIRWFAQLFKQDGQLARYPDPGALEPLLGAAGDPRAANRAPSYRGRRCWAGVEYFTVDRDGRAWRCRAARRQHQGCLGDLLGGEITLDRQPRACPYPMCPCTVPANRGMVAGVGAAP